MVQDRLHIDPSVGFELIGYQRLRTACGLYWKWRRQVQRQVFLPKSKSTSGPFTIALVNTENSTASVTLTAYADNGTAVSKHAAYLRSHAMTANLAEGFFSQSITNATPITYASDVNMVGLQLDGSMDWRMLDGLPVLAGDTTYSITAQSIPGAPLGQYWCNCINCGEDSNYQLYREHITSLTFRWEPIHFLSLNLAYVTYTNPAYYVGGNQAGLNFYIVTASSSLVCPEYRSVSSNGIQFYGTTSYSLSTTTYKMFSVQTH